MESVLRRLYRNGWPARLWGLSPFAEKIDLVELTLPLLPQGVPPLKVAFASDLHLGPTTAAATRGRSLNLLRQACPDVLLLGGDYVFLDATEKIADELEAWVSTVAARTTVAVWGNHDLWTYHEVLERALSNAGARVLINESMALPPPHHEVSIVGLDDPQTGQIDGEAAFAGVGKEQVKIVVCHSSDALETIRGRGATLLLAGHTHGGQIALPGSVPVIVPGRFGRQYPYGRHSVDGLELIVSRGIGGVELPIRTFARPDVIVLKLKAGMA